MVHPRAEVMQMTEMASINNRVYRTLSSPMIFAKDNVLTLRPESKEGMVMAIDHLTYDANEIEEIQLQISGERIFVCGVSSYTILGSCGRCVYRFA